MPRPGAPGRWRKPTTSPVTFWRRFFRDWRKMASSHPSTARRVAIHSPAPANQISVAEIVQAIDGTLSLTECSSADGNCLQFETCNVKSPLQRLHDRVVRMLSTLTIAQMVEQESKIPQSGNPESMEELPVLQ